jgi:hypothetical protein
MVEERNQFAQEKAERERLLADKQRKELEEFDCESTRRGFSALAVCEPSQERYPDGDDGSDGAGTVISGSTLSLAHSHSMSSVGAGPTSL